MSETIVFIESGDSTQTALHEEVFVSHTEQEVFSIAAGAQGPSGPKGDAGADGADGATGPQGVPGLSGANYVHNQMTPSDNWVINHGLNRYPSVTIVDSAGSVVVGAVEYDSQNQITVTFTAAFGGSAYLN